MWQSCIYVNVISSVYPGAFPENTETDMSDKTSTAQSVPMWATMHLWYMHTHTHTH